MSHLVNVRYRNNATIIANSISACNPVGPLVDQAAFLERNGHFPGQQHIFATMLGGPERKHLFMCTSASHDPIITRRMASATTDIAVVKTPCCGIP